MRFDRPLVEATFISRPNRFVVKALLGEAEVTAHVANSGRLEELLHADNTLLLARVPEGPARRTGYDLVLVDVDGVLVSADAQLPNTLFAEALEARKVPEFSRHAGFRREVRLGESRIDFALSRPDGDRYVEVKSVTLVVDGVGLFPDAPTARGRRHVQSLVAVVEQGHGAAVVFVVQRPNVSSFSPNRSADPQFCDALRDAAHRGIDVFAYRCDVRRDGVDLTDRVPIELG
ncbi:MAG: DNA/RNA nuclease SfsA [Chloroflexi bacterium]|nr:DNA/RNA nuclease SfsA [Chloroflexota bacterium]